jgi:K+-transporting ATPase ATPase C chain
VFFPYHANGSLIERGDKIMGSALLGQQFNSPEYFWSRLSATTPPYNPAASGGSNLGPDNPKLLKAANKRIEALQQADPHNKWRIPSGLVTASGSGVDPDISIPGMLYQLPRVAKARNMSEGAVRALAAKATETPVLGILGRPYVNVLKLNLSLDESDK